MLTQQQANDYNIWQHELEAIEIGQNMAQKQINSYVNAMSKVSDMMATATPEMMDRIRKVVPRLVEGYNNAKLKLSSYEDRHQQALSKVNEYRALEAEPNSITKRRTIIPDNFDWNTWWNNEYSNTDTNNTTNTLDTYKDNPLYPEFQEFLNWRNNKNNEYKTDSLYPEFQEFLKWRDSGKSTSGYTYDRPGSNYILYRSTLPEQQKNNTPTYGTVFKPNTNRFSLYS